MTSANPLTDASGEVRELTQEDFAHVVPFSGLPVSLQAKLVKAGTVENPGPIPHEPRTQNRDTVTSHNNLENAMPMYNEPAARDAAVNLVTKALESGAIKLGGPNSAASPAAAGGNDADYLLTLINKLKESLSS